MSYETQKVQIIEQVLHIENEAVLVKMQKLLEEAKWENAESHQPVALSGEEYFRRQDAAEEDARMSRVIPQAELKAHFANRAR